MNEEDIANFAANLLEKEVEKGKPVQFAASQPSDAPDVSDVEVPEDYAHQIFEEGHWDKAEVPVSPVRRKSIREKVEVREERQPEILTEATVYKKYLIREYKKKVGDLQELVELMESFGMVTGSGSLGVGAGGRTAEDPMKDEEKKKGKQRRKKRATLGSYRRS